ALKLRSPAGIGALSSAYISASTFSHRTVKYGILPHGHVTIHSPIDRTVYDSPATFARNRVRDRRRVRPGSWARAAGAGTLIPTGRIRSPLNPVPRTRCSAAAPRSSHVAAALTGK